MEIIESGGRGHPACERNQRQLLAHCLRKSPSQLFDFKGTGIRIAYTQGREKLKRIPRPWSLQRRQSVFPELVQFSRSRQSLLLKELGGLIEAGRVGGSGCTSGKRCTLQHSRVSSLGFHVGLALSDELQAAMTKHTLGPAFTGFP